MTGLDYSNFYQVPDLKFDIKRLRYKKILSFLIVSSLVYLLPSPKRIIFGSYKCENYSFRNCNVALYIVRNTL